MKFCRIKREWWFIKSIIHNIRTKQWVSDMFIENKKLEYARMKMYEEQMKMYEEQKNKGEE